MDNNSKATHGPSRKRKVADSNEKDSPIMKRTKTTPSTGQKRTRKPTPPQKKTLTYTVEGVLDKWSDTTEYGMSFRGLTTSEQLLEVDVLNKGAAKGLKGIVKNTLLAKQYTKVIHEKMRLYFTENRDPLASMIHAAPKLKIGAIANIKLLSVGEWVEVDADRTPGFNSEGGIGVITGVDDDMADVK
jgi:hypothetical protein